MADELSLLMNDELVNQALQSAEATKYDAPIQAGIEGVARGVTFGLSDAALAGLGGDKVKEGLAKRQEYNPIAAGVGEAAGVAGSLFMPGFNLVKGVGAVGRFGEAAAAKALVDVAAQSTAKKILSNAAAKGLGSAIEGAFYGAGQVVSEAALGDPDVAAEHALSTIGLSSLLSGGLVGGLNVVGPAIKQAAISAKPLLKQARQQFVGVSPDIEATILNRADELKELIGTGDNIESSILTRFDELASKTSQRRYETINDAHANIAKIIQDKSLQGEKQNITEVFKAIDDAKAKLAPSGRAATDIIQRELDEMSGIERRMVDSVLENAGLEVPPRNIPLGWKDLQTAEIPKSAWNLNAMQLNDLKHQYQKSAKFNTVLGQSSDANDLYKTISRVFDAKLGKIDKGIKANNLRLHKSMVAQEELRRYGFFEAGAFDANKMSELASAGDKVWAKLQKPIKTLDEVWGTDIYKTAELARAAKKITPKDLLSGSQTGRSLLGPALGASLGSVLGGPVAAGLGVLGGTVLGSPAGISAKIKLSNAIGDMLSSNQASKLASFGGKAGALVSHDMVPFISSQIAGLSAIERAQKSMDRQIEASIRGFQNAPEKETPTSLTALTTTNFGKGRVLSEDDRQRAFEKRLEEITKMVTSPEIMADMISNNLKGLSMIAPNIANSLSMQAANAAMYLYSKAPKPLEPNAIGLKQKWTPSDSQLASWERYVDAVESPKTVLNDFKNRRLTKEGVETLQTIYPKIYDALLKKVSEKFYDKSLKYQDRLTLSQMFKLPVDNAMKPQQFAVLQSNFNQQQPQQTPVKSGDVQFSNSRQTQSQRIEAR